MNERTNEREAKQTKIGSQTIPSRLSSFYVHIKINICDIQNDIKSLFYISFEWNKKKSHDIAWLNEAEQNRTKQSELVYGLLFCCTASSSLLTHGYWILSKYESKSKIVNVHKKCSFFKSFLSLHFLLKINDQIEYQIERGISSHIGRFLSHGQFSQ